VGQYILFYNSWGGGGKEGFPPPFKKFGQDKSAFFMV